MTNTAMNRDPDLCPLKDCTFEETNVYIDKTTGASVTADSAISLIRRYCEKLPGDKYVCCFLLFYHYFRFTFHYICVVCHYSLILLPFHCRYYMPKPSFKLTCSEGLYKCNLTLPVREAFQTIVGPVSKNSHLAKQLVCLEACKLLHQMGALDYHLIPSVEVPSENHSISKGKVSDSNSDSGAGIHNKPQLLFNDSICNSNFGFECLRKVHVSHYGL